MGCCCSTETKDQVLEENLIRNSKDEPKESAVHNPVVQRSESIDAVPVAVPVAVNVEHHTEPEAPKEEALADLKVEINSGRISEIEDSLQSVENLSTTDSSATLSKKTSRASFKRQSSTVTKEHREFRFFLPIIDERTDTFLTNEQKVSYNNNLQKLISALNLSDKMDEEVRDDTYLIGQSYFNLKYRDDQKLEMKVKTKNFPIWQEKWSTVRFGKKPMKHYRSGK